MTQAEKSIEIERSAPEDPEVSRLWVDRLLDRLAGNSVTGHVGYWVIAAYERFERQRNRFYIAFGHFELALQNYQNAVANGFVPRPGSDRFGVSVEDVSEGNGLRSNVTLRRYPFPDTDNVMKPEVQTIILIGSEGVCFEADGTPKQYSTNEAVKLFTDAQTALYGAVPKQEDATVTG